MGLTDFLYRCPVCGKDPVEGQKTRARCPDCGARFEAAPRDGGIHVAVGDETRIEAAWTLADSMEEKGGAVARATSGEGTLEYSATAAVRFSTEQRTLRHRGSVLGFIEEFGPATAGRIRITDEALFFEEEGGREHVWHLMDLRAVQTSSSTVQVTLQDGRLVSFRFSDDSTRRWESLLYYVLRRCWKELGRGEILEFQPRIRAE